MPCRIPIVTVATTAAAAAGMLAVVVVAISSRILMTTTTATATTTTTFWMLLPLNVEASSLPSHIVRARIPEFTTDQILSTQESSSFTKRFGQAPWKNPFQQQQQQQRQRRQRQQQSQPQRQQKSLPQQLWLYSGSLYDPLDGRQIANVQGLELVRPVTNTTGLAMDRLLAETPTHNATESKTLWSQKVFCYTTTTPQTTNSSASSSSSATTKAHLSNLLQHVRLRPRSPKKVVPLDQAVTVYETATTFISQPRARRQKNNEEDEQEQLLVHSEFPNGQTLWGMADHRQPPSSSSTSSSLAASGLDFTVYTKLRNRHSLQYAPDLTMNQAQQQQQQQSENDNDNNEDDSGAIVVSPKRSALIQFGSSSNTMESKHKFGARETYSYRTTTTAAAAAAPPTKVQKRHQLWWRNLPWIRSPSSTVPATTLLYYTRYGEGPPFYAPGRMCMLELSAKPIANLDGATPLLQQLVSENGAVVNFSTSNSGSSTTTIQDAWGLTHSKRGNGGKGRPSRIPQQQLLHLKTTQQDETKSWPRIRRHSKQAMILWERIQKATAIEAAL